MNASCTPLITINLTRKTGTIRPMATKTWAYGKEKLKSISAQLTGRYDSGYDTMILVVEDR